MEIRKKDGFFLGWQTNLLFTNLLKISITSERRVTLKKNHEKEEEYQN